MPPPGKNAAKRPPKKATKASPIASKVPGPPGPPAPKKVTSKRTKAPRGRATGAKSKAKSSRPRAAKTPRESAQVQQPPIDYQGAYSDDSFWAKVKGYGKAAGSTVLGPALTMYYAGKDVATPMWARGTITGALGYLISPLDAIPDFTPVIGYTDDLGVLTLAVAVVAGHITPAHKEQATEKLREWFD